MLKVEGLTVQYAQTGTAVHDINLQINEGDSLAILGANGAGKTSTISGVVGFPRTTQVKVTARTLEFDGIPLLRLSPHKIARLGISLVPERNKIFRQLTVKENLRLANPHADAVVESLVDDVFPILQERAVQRAGFLSGGQAQMLAIAMAIMRRPSLLIADEISLGLAPALVDEITDALLALRDRLGLSILVVEQNVGVAKELCERAIVLDTGRLSADARLTDLLEDDRLAKIYLGTIGDQQ